jgi:hypothetical protein
MTGVFKFFKYTRIENLFKFNFREKKKVILVKKVSLGLIFS